jgi:hypothetical protein
MTGSVEWPTLIWIVSAISGGFVAGVVILWRVVSWAQAALDERDEAIAMVRKDLSLSDQVIDARAKLGEEALAKQIADTKLHAAEHYVTRDGLADELHGVRTSIDRLSDLLNQLLVQAAGKTPLPKTVPRSRPRGS